MEATKITFNTDNGDLTVTLSRPAHILPIFFGKVKKRYKGVNKYNSIWEWYDKTDRRVFDKTTLAYLYEAKRQFFGEYGL